ncbi:TPA: GmrSD restriction endonuclease domain-containing protein, partial [Haemophilus influenzae]
SILAYLPEQKIRHDKFNELESYFDKFRFSYRHSIEHCYAQNLNKDEDLGYIEKGVKVIDSFGNLCLIEADFNSSLSDNTIPLKREKLLELLRKNRDRSASLKQVIMLMYDDNCWSSQSAKKTIEEHGKRMKELLNESFNS